MVLIVFIFIVLTSLCIAVIIGKKQSMALYNCNVTDSNYFLREQCDREQALEDFKTGAAQVLIATDVASRGLDIKDIT